MVSQTLSSLRAAAKKKGIPGYSSMSKGLLQDFMSCEPWSLGWRFKYIKKQTKSREDLENTVEMILSDVRDIERCKKVRDFLSEHRVSTTMTTSPLRLKKLTAVLATLDIEHLHAINVVLPYRYGRDKKTYKQADIAKLKKFSPLVKVIRVKKDLGPITKMLPVVRKASDKKDIVISIDDDVAYPMGMVNEMIYQKVVKHPKAVIEGGASFFRRGDIRNFRDLWPQKDKKRVPHTDLVEGWEAVAYSKKLVNDKLMEEISKMSKDCFLSDDLVISFVLAKNKIKRVTIDNQYSYNPHPYDYGSEGDALHRGGGAGQGLLADAHSDEFNWQKYGRCLKDICKAGKGPRSCKKVMPKSTTPSKSGDKKRSKKKSNRKPKRSRRCSRVRTRPKKRKRRRRSR